MPISHDAAGRSFTNKIVSVLSASAADAQELSINALAAEAVSRYPPIDWRPNLLRRESSNARGSYRDPVLRLWEIGSVAPRGLTVREVALTFMQELHKAMHWNVHLAVLGGYEALYVMKISGHPCPRRGSATDCRYTPPVWGRYACVCPPSAFSRESVERSLTPYTLYTVIAPGVPWGHDHITVVDVSKAPGHSLG
jgi:hypothetical protein